METKYAKIRPRRDTAANLKSANPILLAGELCYEFETVVGKGSAKQKMGDGSTAYNQLQYIANDDVTDKVVSSFDTVTDQNPVLSAGKSIKYYLGAIKKKFDYYLSLINSKIGTDKIYSGLDSSNSTQVLAATAGKQLKELCDKNTKGVSDLNSNLEQTINNLNDKFLWRDLTNSGATNFKDAVIQCVESIPAVNHVVFCEMIYGSSFLLIIQKHNTQNYDSVLAIGYTLDAPTFYRKINNVWQ